MTASSVADVAWRERDFAPAPGTRICNLDEIPDGAAREFKFGRGRAAFRLLVLRSGESVWGYVNICPHHWIPLNVEPDKFILLKHSRIYCAMHSSRFRFEDGYCEDGPCAGASLEKVSLALAGNAVNIAPMQLAQD